MKRIFLLISIAISLLGTLVAHGQSIWPSTLNATGGYAIIEGIEYDYSIGEIALVSTFTTSSIVVTQGLLQSDLGDGSTAEVPKCNALSQMQVFPNPSSSIVNIQFSAATNGSMTVRLSDLTGRLILQQKAEVKQGANFQQVDVSAVAAALYILEVSYLSADGKNESITYKIQKLN